MVKISPAPRRQRRSEGEERKCGHGEVGKNGGGLHRRGEGRWRGWGERKMGFDELGETGR